MKRYVYLILVLLPLSAFAQTKLKAKNYPSLLWEITGNGMKKPSYLFGTMHVSSKLAFHLADSFYLGIRNADVVALETNPESWQEDMSKYELANSGYDSYDNQYRLAVPNDYFSINTLKFFKYDKKIERALYSNPSAINNLLYRSNDDGGNDFEEDTYLDMYIYQCGKKWGKKVAGVERYAESMKLMMEAYKDAAKDKNTKVRSYDSEDGFASSKLQEAYRSGNLDWLDSINKYNSFSAAFDEKFLYKRNEIQASSIDSILKSGQSLFVGVGAAHLPGNRGVIEMLRRAGYRLRPVKMGARDSQHKNLVEKVRVAVPFSTQQADDGLYKVDIPGKFYKFGDDASLDQRQYADMANGSYYMVTRVSTNAWMWGHSSVRVAKIVDSLLYENIPGKIIAKTKIVRNGYPGIDLTNKTRRGDIQRYNIFITPFEVVIFKMSGTGDYVKNGEEARKFFGSIQLKEYKPADIPAGSWKKYSPPYGGFSIDMPHEPNIDNDGSWIYDAEDKINNAQYRVIRSDIHNYHFAEEDTFDLNLMAESFESSEFISKNESRIQKTYKGYPALDCKYQDKSGGLFLTRFIIQGPHYYTLVAHGKHSTPAMEKFLNSFDIQPFKYNPAKDRKDTSLYYTVKSPVFPEAGKAKLDIPKYTHSSDDDDELLENDLLENGAFRSRIIANDSTGEKIFVSFFKMQRYTYVKDSTVLDKENQTSLFSDSSGIVKLKRKFELPNKTKVWETVITDTGSSRTIWSKVFYKNGIGYALQTQSDTLNKPSSFVQSFFDSFVPADTLTGINPFTKKTNLFFTDFMSTDSVAHKRAVKNIYSIKLDSADLGSLKKVIAFLDWKEKKYLDVKKDLVSKLDDIKNRQASDYLQELYYAAGDTVELQHKVLEVLLQQKTPYSFKLFKDIMLNEPPVLDIGRSNDYSSVYSGEIKALARIGYDDGNFIDELHDSLQLTKTILSELLPLLNLDDYKYSMMQLLAEMVDSSMIKPKDYDLYYSKFLIEARQELKRQAIAEKQKAINKAEEKKEDKKDAGYDDSNDSNTGNEKLQLYATLLLPYWDVNPAVQPLFKQLLSSGDKKLTYDIMLLLLRNKRPYPDSLLNYFAALDNYRYNLYTDLREISMEKKFPALYNNHIDLAKSKLLDKKSYDKPDSVVYLDRLDAQVKNKKGFIYFFKYKTKKDDASWKIASVGLVPRDARQFEFEEEEKKSTAYFSIYDNSSGNSSYDFTAFTDTKLRPDEPVMNQLKKQRKKLLYSARKSAKEFYNKDDSDSYETESEID
ncbi:TraB/GumN family protein [Terrimonas pollutisoli]|uniref:TraB/GumN family protein n=1 Tax=Terrimonas pollutisoli TaxID=3034147 RepID=UPI0023EB4B13|nr:TraB/GumN family protein [Terrimonas sp. H1YJ31]